jgi:hypothetical protein
MTEAGEQAGTWLPGWRLVLGDRRARSVGGGGAGRLCSGRGGGRAVEALEFVRVETILVLKLAAAGGEAKHRPFCH